MEKAQPEAAKDKIIPEQQENESLNDCFLRLLKGGKLSLEEIKAIVAKGADPK